MAKSTSSWNSSCVFPDEEFAIRIRLIPALAFAAPYEVACLFGGVSEHLLTSASDDLIQYFERLISDVRSQVVPILSASTVPYQHVDVSL